MLFLRSFFLGGLIFGLAILPEAWAHWVEKAGYIDYAQHQAADCTVVLRDGMPDFDQRQDGWQNAVPQWNWCGPLAAANCLWWFDSKLEMVKCKSLPSGSEVRPPTISDHYNLVRSLVAGVDDHDPRNVVPFISTLGASFPGGVPATGMNAAQIRTMIDNYLSSAMVNLWGHYSIRVYMMPSFEWIYAQVDSSQDILLLLGFWQQQPGGDAGRFGGHWVTVAGVDRQNDTTRISFSDPYQDHAELGFPGNVWNGWLTPHAPIPGHGSAVHNDAGNVSHDWYVVGPSYTPGGLISPQDYGLQTVVEMWRNFDQLNFPPGLEVYRRPYIPGGFVHTEIEIAIVICPNFDYGDLLVDYPTIDIESCGPAHPLTDKAWLGESISAEVKPRIDTAANVYNLDNADDGVTFFGLPWSPGQVANVNVWVSTGAHYLGEPLVLNAWMDGNLDGDFDDGPAVEEDDFLVWSEWIIPDMPIPMAGVYNVAFNVPGAVTYPISTWIRFRLTSQNVNRFGYGGYWGGGVSNGLGTYDIDWTLGEVEDYIYPPPQLHPIDDLVIHVGGVGGPIELYWTAPEIGLYFIYTTENPNNHGDPRHESGWNLEDTLFLVAGPASWTTLNLGLTDLKYYVIVYETP
ncbi:hypothetical protein KKH27_00195 [bacterium]|nr:hypothetical protein [bacterium]MBU1984925.1 hypothetical protein [bacterium]